VGLTTHRIKFTRSLGHGLIIWITVRRIFGPRRDEVTRDWRKLRNEELHNLHSSPNIIRMMKEDEMGMACSTNRGDEECV
jgi:hypothetical protein